MSSPRKSERLKRNAQKTQDDSKTSYTEEPLESDEDEYSPPNKQLKKSNPDGAIKKGKGPKKGPNPPKKTSKPQSEKSSEKSDGKKPESVENAGKNPWGFPRAIKVWCRYCCWPDREFTTDPKKGKKISID